MGNGSDSRHVAVAGGGIGGLTASLALAQAGFRVTVYERSPTPGDTGAGLQLSPNATMVLGRLGVLPAIREMAVVPEAVMIRRGRDGRLLARLPLGHGAEARYRAPFLVTRRADLHRALLECAETLPGVTLRPGMSVAHWTSSSTTVELRLEGVEGRTRVDALVGADGIHSIVRKTLFGQSADELVHSGRTAWRATIDAGRVPDSFLAPQTNLWLGPEAHVVHYSVAAGRAVNVVAILGGAATGGIGAGFWSTPGDPATLLRRFEGWCEPLRNLLASAPGWRTWPLLDRAPLPRWSRGPVTLLGDAAHPMLPFLAQGAAQAIEDAAVLARSLLKADGDAGAGFHAYETERKPRTARVQAQSRRQGFIYHLGAPWGMARDLVLGAMPPDRLLARYDWLYGHAA